MERMLALSAWAQQVAQAGDSSATGMVAGLVGLVASLAVIAGAWMIFDKAGEPGWAALVPIYNVVVFLRIVGRPIWWVVLLLIPVVNLVVSVVMAIDLAKSFGKGMGYGLGLAFLAPVFYPHLGISGDSYVGPQA